MTAILVFALAVAVVAAIYARVLFRRYMAERLEKGRVVSLFSRYVPAPVVQELLARRDPRLFQAREYYATIVCCRIHNFALLCESLSPEETLRYLNEFYTLVGRAVQNHRGMIESLRGDTVMAVFGVLLEEHHQEDRALRASLDIMRLVKAMEARWQSQSRKAFTVGIGVNSGKIVAGDTGFQQRQRDDRGLRGNLQRGARLVRRRSNVVVAASRPEAPAERLHHSRHDAARGGGRERYAAHASPELVCQNGRGKRTDRAFAVTRSRDVSRRREGRRREDRAHDLRQAHRRLGCRA
jgi:class 3 adenylate cyclase